MALPQGIHYVKYESSIPYDSKVMSKAEIICRQTDKQTGQRVYALDLLMCGHENALILYLACQLWALPVQQQIKI